MAPWNVKSINLKWYTISRNWNGLIWLFFLPKIHWRKSSSGQYSFLKVSCLKYHVISKLFPKCSVTCKQQLTETDLYNHIIIIIISFSMAYFLWWFLEHFVNHRVVKSSMLPVHDSSKKKGTYWKQLFGFVSADLKEQSMKQSKGNEHKTVRAGLARITRLPQAL